MGARSTIRFLSPVLLPCLAAVRLDLRICQLGFSWIRRFIPSLMCVVTSSIEVGEAASGKSLLSLVYEWNVIQKSLIYWRLCDLEAMVVYWWLFRILWSSCPTFVSSVDIGHTVPAEDQVGEPCDGKPSRTGHQRHKAGEYPAQCEASVGRSYAVSWFLTDGFSRFLACSWVALARGSWFGTCLGALISPQINWIVIAFSFISASVIAQLHISSDYWYVPRRFH
ncbi:hypothetical protein F2Q70_00013276 [Brassica cretica]|uniref:Solute carrier family 40 protein n=1 Tax=Brassica cretica TaxID=69181 RepID=A0A8S9LU86_BRACR|nr:hypothetical protein F2Q70_00013276 [Brassica cretica]